MKKGLRLNYEISTYVINWVVKQASEASYWSKLVKQASEAS